MLGVWIIQMLSKYWYDGQLFEQDTICLSIDDPGLNYGATIFTTLRVYQQSLEHPLTQWNAHCHRLEKSLQEFGWCLPNWQQIWQGANHLITTYPVLRIAIFPDGREWIRGRFLPDNLAQSQQQGVKGWLASYPLFQRTLNAHKTGNYLGAWLALQQAKTLDFQEAILVDSQGNWLETSTGNLWGWKQGKWYTPALEVGILPGIGRQQLIHWLYQQNIKIEENQWTPSWIQSLEMIAYSNSVVEVIPFRIIDCHGILLTFDVSDEPLQMLSQYYEVMRCRGDRKNIY
ncbi:putative aminotransferase, class IV [Crocosphaera subtropica ATCC 51142]|uniref:Aminotransferase, class IV n=2 Tax=Crocosphaera TaxID=263510 RepID=B1X1R9_CROS5|nr:putative aminotransferase, class IV [Crocosphaera subtropica ATCC 51142]